MKKITALILSAILISSCFYVSVSAYDKPVESKTVMGDTNFDGRISASDARIVLRNSAKLQNDNLSRLSADANGDSKINATDARIILRKSAKLQNFTTGYDLDGNPCVLADFPPDRYELHAYLSDGNEKESVTMFKNGTSVYIEGSGMSIMNTDDLNIKFKSLVIIGGDYYFNCELESGAASVLKISREFAIKALDMNIEDELSSVFPTCEINSVTSVKKTKTNGKDAYTYYETYDGTQKSFVIDTYGNLISFSFYDTNGSDNSIEGIYPGDFDTGIFSLTKKNGTEYLNGVEVTEL